MSAIAVIATLKVQDGKNAEFEAAFQTAVAAVRANEPDTPLYTLTQSKKDAQLYRVLEIYNTKEALVAHAASAHYQEMAAALAPTLAGEPELDRLNVIF